MLNNGITEEELNDAKTFLKGNLALNFESNEVRMSQLAKNEIIYGKCFTFDEIADQINSVTNEDFVRVCQRLFANKRMSIISLGKLKNTDKENLELQL
jgi:predicted Zn-dependent peptidase